MCIIVILLFAINNLHLLLSLFAFSFPEEDADDEAMMMQSAMINNIPFAHSECALLRRLSP